MAVYFVTGTLGCGKTLCTVGKIRDYLEQGRRVATNLDINLDAFTKADSRVDIIRVPDKPSLWDLEALGVGCEESDESKYGLLVLDELGTWFNSRNWQDKGRLAVINWFLHARKLHWDIFFIVQSVDSLDGQLVNALCEHLVVCKRTDRLNIPFFGKLFKMIGLAGKLPKVHIAKVYYGKSDSDMLVDRWWYRGKDLYGAYNTDQIFSDESQGLSTVLPAYYTNNIALIESHKQSIVTLTKTETVTKSKPDLWQTFAYAALSLLLVVFFVHRTYTKAVAFASDKPHTVLVSPTPIPTPIPAPIPTLAAPVPAPVRQVDLTIAVETDNFIDDLLKTTKPRLSWLVESKQTGESQGAVEFYQVGKMVERFKITELHALGVAMVRTEYGYNMIYKGKTYIVPWAMPKADRHELGSSPSLVKESRGSKCHPKTTMTDEEIKECSS